MWNRWRKLISPTVFPTMLDAGPINPSTMDPSAAATCSSPSPISPRKSTPSRLRAWAMPCGLQANTSRSPAWSLILFKGSSMGMPERTISRMRTPGVLRMPDSMIPFPASGEWILINASVMNSRRSSGDRIWVKVSRTGKRFLEKTIR